MPPLSCQDRRRLREHRVRQDRPPRRPRLPRSRQHDLDLSYTRLVLGVDLLATLAVDTEREERTYVALDVAKPGGESEGDQARLDAASRAVNRLSAEKIETMRRRIQSTGRPPAFDELYKTIGQHVLAEWLFDRPTDYASSAEMEPPPLHKAVIGWWPEPRHKDSPTGFYLAAWQSSSYEAAFTPNQAAEQVHKFMLKFRPPSLEDGGKVHVMPYSRRGTCRVLSSGTTQIPLRGDREWLYDSISERFYLSGLEPLVYTGHGPDEASARSDLIARVQRDFQALYGTRPPDRDEHEEHLWTMLGRVIDLDEIHAREELRVTRVGHVQRFSGDAREVQWEDDDEIEYIAPGQAPHEFFKLPKGQRFEAMALYAFGTDNVKAIEAVRAINKEVIDHAKVAAFEEYLRNKAEKCDEAPDGGER